MIELVCPVCWGELDFIACDCERCGFVGKSSYDVVDMIPQADLHDPVVLAEIDRYERIAGSGAAAYAGHAETKPELRARVMAGLLGPGEFVEVGPGFGELMRATTGDRWAVDQSWAFLKRLEAEALPGVHLVRALADRLPFGCATVPRLAADSVLQTVPDRERFLCEAARVLEPGGTFAFSVAYRWNYPRRPQQGFDVRDSEQEVALRRFLEELGLEVVLWSYLSLGNEDWTNFKVRGDLLYAVAVKEQ